MPKSNTCILSVLLFIFYFLPYCLSGRISFNDVQISGNEITFSRSGMFSPSDAPSDSSPGNGRSFIAIDVNFKQETISNSGWVTTLIFQSKEKRHLGYTDANDEVHLCCTTELQNRGICNSVGNVIIQANQTDSTAGSTFSMQITYFTGNVSSSLTLNHDILVSGIYYVYFVNCKSNDAGIVMVDGIVTFMNPYGYLNGELFYYLPFYGIISLVYLVLGIFWFVLSLKHRSQLLKLQNCIAGVIALGMIESATLYFDNLGYNNIGENFIGAMIVGVIVSTVKRTISRILVLVVSMGYGVMKPTLGTTAFKVAFLGILYFLFSGALNILELVQRTSIAARIFLYYLVFPVAFLDTVFYWWIFVSILKTISQLQLRKQTIKLQMYRKFLITLVVSGIISSMVIFSQLVVQITTDPDDTWQTDWIWTAFWHILYLAILVSIAIIWRPTTNNTRYAYNELSVDAEGEEEIHLQSLSLISQRKGKEEETSKQDEPEEVKVSGNTKDLPMIEIPVSFSIDDNDEEAGGLERSKLQ